MFVGLGFDTTPDSHVGLLLAQQNPKTKPKHKTQPKTKTKSKHKTQPKTKTKSKHKTQPKPQTPNPLINQKRLQHFKTIEVKNSVSI